MFPCIFGLDYSFLYLWEWRPPLESKLQLDDEDESSRLGFFTLVALLCEPSMSALFVATSDVEEEELLEEEDEKHLAFDSSIPLFDDASIRWYFL